MHRPEGLAIAGLADDAAGLGPVAAPLAAGDAVLFSSLTPHKTGPNLTGRTRKALIVQLAPADVAFVAPDGTRTPKDDARLNPLILRAGKPV